MSLILALGSNLGNKRDNISKAIISIEKHFKIIYQGPQIETEPVDYLSQPTFLNLAIECETPDISPLEVLNIIKKIEVQNGRTISEIPKGPRIIDIDILFWNKLKFSHNLLKIPHQEIVNRPFIYEIIKDLPSFKGKINNFEELTLFVNDIIDT